MGEKIGLMKNQTPKLTKASGILKIKKFNETAIVPSNMLVPLPSFVAPL